MTPERGDSRSRASSVTGRHRLGAPDGKWIGFAMFTPKPKPSGLDIRLRRPGERAVDAGATLCRNLHYRADRRGFLESGFVHLFIVPTGTRYRAGSYEGRLECRIRASTRPALSVGAGRAMGSRSVFDGLMSPDSDKTYRDSDINIVDVATSTMRKLSSTRGSWSRPVVSPDGQWIAVSGYEFTPQTYKTSELYVMRLDGSGMKKISANLDRDVGELTWAQDGSGVYFSAGDRGAVNVHFATLAGAVRQVTSGAHILSLGTISRAWLLPALCPPPQQPR